MRRIAFLAALVAAVLAGPAAATAPERSTTHRAVQVEFPAGGLCPFSVVETGEVDVDFTTFADGSLIAHEVDALVYENAETGRRVLVRSSYTAHVDAADGSGRTVGALVEVRDPDGALLFTQAGQIAFGGGGLTKVTPHAAALGSAAFLCTALAEPAP